MKKLDLPSSFCPFITSAREKAKLNKTNLAQIIGVSSPMIGYYECGVKVPTKEVFLKLVRALSLTAEEVQPYLASYDLEVLPDYDDTPPLMGLAAIRLKDIPYIARVICTANVYAICTAIANIGECDEDVAQKVVKMALIDKIELPSEKWEEIILALS